MLSPAARHAMSALPVGALLVGALVAAGCSDNDNGAAGPGGGGTGTGGMGGTGGGTGGGGEGGAAGATSGAAGGAGEGGGGSGGGCTNTLPNEAPLPPTLSATGLYQSIAKKDVAAYAQPFQPKYQLWSDAADKQRWVYLPECGKIDSKDMDHWELPVGTRMWKEFKVGGKRIETRLVHLHGAGKKDVAYGAYLWREDESDADLVPNGVVDALGTEHDVPDVDACKRCHGPHPSKGGLPSRYLGFSAIQLSHAGPGVTIDALVQAGALTVAAPSGGYKVPGSAVEEVALGYFHANCGNCHNTSDDGLLFPFFDARVSVTDTMVSETGIYETTINKVPEFFITPSCSHVVKGGDPTQSCMHFRMSERGSDEVKNNNQMPPIASDVVDAAGLALVKDWILTLPPPQ